METGHLESRGEKIISERTCHARGQEIRVDYRDDLRCTRVEGNKNWCCDKECGICLDPLDRWKITLPCSHQFHLRCLGGLTNSQCPTCREEFMPSLFYTLVDDVFWYADEGARRSYSLEFVADHIGVKYNPENSEIFSLTKLLGAWNWGDAYKLNQKL